VTVAEALGAIRRVGRAENRAGRLTLRFPEAAASELQPAIDTLRIGKAEALALLSSPDPAELGHASAVLSRAGVRIMALEDGAAIGVWSDLDGPEIRAALGILGLSRLPVRYLDGSGIAVRYEVRRMEGEPVPMSALDEMERHSTEPWKVRDRMLQRMNWLRAKVNHK
jgi:hypothetical protein